MNKYAKAKYLFHHNGVTFEQEKFMNDVIDEALEKQIPQKVTHTNDSYFGEIPVCPVCDYYLVPIEFINLDMCEQTDPPHKFKKISYCDHCGQAIDWRATDTDRLGW